MQDLTGQIFGRLTVLRQNGEDKRGKPMWECVCICGGKKTTMGYSLTRNQTRSCGCLQKEATAAFVLNLVGRRVGRLLVVRSDGFRDKLRGKTNQPYREYMWHCKCDCGNTCYVSTNQLTTSNTKSCGCLRKELAGKWFKGKIYNKAYEPDRSKALLRGVCKSHLARAKKRGFTNLTHEDVEGLISGACHYCGTKGSNTKQDLQNGKKVSDTVLNYNGIDRVDSSQGYTRDNVVSCCCVCNVAKNDLCQQGFKEHIERIYHHFCQRVK